VGIFCELYGRMVFWAFMIFVLVFGFAFKVVAQDTDDLGERVPTKSHMLDEFLVEKLQPLIENGSIPGAVFIIVEGDQITVSKGLGYSDVAEGKPMDPDTTLMRIGSITKSFTALAIHQLVSKGEIDLDADANIYLLSEKIPTAYGAPVTVRQLLSHRSGFDGNLSYVSSDTNDNIAIEQGWISRQLIRLRPPGDVFAYDNSAYAALGQILVDQYGESYAGVIKEQVFAPLNMRDSVVGVPDTHLEAVAKCYNRASGSLKLCKHQNLKETYQAAGAISATASDMGKFLIALLNEGDVDGTAILGKQQFEEFSTTSHRLHPMGPGVGLGAYEMGPPGHGVFGHSGGIRGGSSMYVVLPQDNIAVFVSTNSSLSTDIITTLSGMLSLAASSSVPNNYDPGDLTTFELPSKIPALFYDVEALEERAGTCPITNLAGSYQYLRPIMFSSFAIRFLGPIAMSPVIVEKRKDGLWHIEDKGPYEEIAPCHFRLRDGKYSDGEIATLVSFAKTDTGELVAGSHPLAAWIKLPWHASPLISVLPYPLAIVVLLILGFLYSVMGGEKRRVFQLSGLGAVLLLIGLYLEMEYQTPVYQYGGHVVPMILWRGVFHVGLLLIAVSVLKTSRTVVDVRHSVGLRMASVLLILASFVIISLSFYWGLVGVFIS